MTQVVNIFPYIFPALVVCIAVVLCCFYLHIKKKRATYEVTVPTPRDGNTSVELYTIPLSEGQAEEERHYDTLPPRYSTVDFPPPYSLFDPKLTVVWPGGPPPDYEMYPLTLPLASHQWRTPTGPQHPTPSTPTSTHHSPQTPRLHQAPTH